MNSLDAFIESFAGYGTMSAPIWFVGLEEGGGRDVAELERRVGAWDSRGRRRFEDLASYHVAIGLARNFEAPFPLQRTWTALGRVLLAWRGDTSTVDNLRSVQCTELGASNGSASLLELLPLPAASIASWPYASLQDQRPELCSREQYAATVTPRRIAMLRALIDEGCPKLIVFYGLSRLEEWASIIDARLLPVEIAGRRCFHSTAGASYAIAVPHPVAFGTSNELWQSIGTHLRQVIG